MQKRNEIQLEQHKAGDYIPFMVKTTAGALYRLGLVVYAKPHAPGTLKLVDLPVASMDETEIVNLATMRAAEWGGAAAQ